MHAASVSAAHNFFRGVADAGRMDEA